MMSEKCKIEGCNNIIHARGWCNNHYQKWRKHGDPLFCYTKLDLEKCSVDGCNNVACNGRGWCNKHYQRWRRHGDPYFSVIQFIQNNLYQEKGYCTPEWPHAKTGGGHANCMHPITKNIVQAGLIAWEIYYNKCWPEGMEVRHKCRNRDCFNPLHIEPGTKSDNLGKDKLRDGTDIRGEKHHMHKLTKDEVHWIKAQRGLLSQREIANALNITQSNVSAIHLGKSWDWLQG